MRIEMKRFLTKIKEAVMPAVAVLPLFGILAGLGYALCPAVMMGGEVTTAANRIGWILSRSAGAIYDNRGFLVACTAGYILSGRKPAGALGGLAGVLLFNSYSGIPFFTVFFPAVLDAPLSLSALYGTNAFTGLLLGWVASLCVKRLPTNSHPVCSVMAGTAVLSAVSLILIGTRIGLFHLIAAVGNMLAGGGVMGAAAFTGLNRLLSPFELHRPLNYAVLSEAGAGDMSRFWAQVTEGDPGLYMSGFFPPMMFGIPAGCLFLSRKSGNRRFHIFILLTAVCAFACGLAEPFEYWLLLTSPAAYLGYVMIYVLSAWLAGITGFRAGFACSAGFVDLLFSSAMPAAARTWLVLPLGLVCAGLFLLLFMRLCTGTGAVSDIIETEDGEEHS